MRVVFPGGSIEIKRPNGFPRKTAYIKVIAVLVDRFRALGRRSRDAVGFAYAKNGLDLSDCVFERPIVLPKKKVHTSTSSALLLFASTLIAEPCTSFVLVVESITVLATAKRTGAVLVRKLRFRETSKARQDEWPMATGDVVDFLHFRAFVFLYFR